MTFHTTQDRRRRSDQLSHEIAQRILHEVLKGGFYNEGRRVHSSVLDEFVRSYPTKEVGARRGKNKLSVELFDLENSRKTDYLIKTIRVHTNYKGSSI